MMTMTYDEWLESPYYDNEEHDAAYEEMIEAYVDDVMKAGSSHDPKKMDNIIEALAETNDNNKAQLQSLFITNPIEFHHLVELISNTYWEHYAKEEAIRRYEQGEINYDDYL